MEAFMSLDDGAALGRLVQIHLVEAKPHVTLTRRRLWPPPGHV